MKIGFIGLGHMGRGMALRLLERGHELTVYNRTAAKAEPLAKAGARVARSPAEAADGAEILVTMLADDAAVEAALFGEDGAASALPRGSIHVSMSTISPSMSTRLADSHRDAGQRYVAAPVLGRPDAAERGELAIVAAGPKESIERCEPIFQALAAKTHVAGEDPKQANVVKLGANFLFAVLIEALGESFELVESYGLDAERFLDIVNGSLGSPFVAAYGRRIAERQFHPAGFSLELGDKDVRLVQQAALQGTVDVPLAAFLEKRFAAALARGLAGEDWSVVGRRSAHHEGAAPP
jgi:3-hydroxyisobutyrate dehydrogenase-like beta-hydroxyacid dehydrogenase